MLLVIALIVRGFFVTIPSYHHSDELYQYIEQANRLITGLGVIPWEYRDGIRSWLLPLVLAPPMWLGDRLGIGAAEGARAAASLISLLVVYAFYRFGRAISPVHALIVGFVGATWFELVYFGSHPLTEAIGLALFLPGAILLKEGPAASRRDLVLGGLLLGLAIVLRFQMAPAVAVLVAMTCRLEIRKAWLPAIAGGLVALMISAIVDLAMGTLPFDWLFKNFAVNIFEDRASLYGVSHPLYYFYYLATLWQTSALVLIPLSLIGARRYPALYVAAIVHLLLHSLIGHKEYRFILLTTTVIIFFAAVGFADLLEKFAKGRPTYQRNLAIVAALIFWGMTSVMLGAGERFREQWTKHYPGLTATRVLSKAENVCGVAIYDMRFFEAGGYTFLRRNVPIYSYDQNLLPDFERTWRASNVAIAPQSVRTLLDRDFKMEQCIAPIGFSNTRVPGSREDRTICIYRRPAACDNRGAMPLNGLLRKIGQ